MPFLVSAVVETSAVPWGIDSIVVVKKSWFGGQENLSSSCPGDVTQGTRHCVFAPSGPSCVKWIIECALFLRRKTEKKVYMEAFVRLKSEMVLSSYYYYEKEVLYQRELGGIILANLSLKNIPNFMFW